MGFFDKLLRKKEVSERAQGSALVSEQTGTFTVWSGDAYGNDVYRAAVDAIARNVAKLKGSHVIRYADHSKTAGECKLNRLLQIRPNPYMSAYDFLYKVTTRYYTNNNAFAFLDRDERGNVCGIYPITETYVDMMSDEAGELYCRFTVSSGKTFTFRYADVIHLRRNFNTNELLGDSNDALFPALELAHTTNEGIINGVKAGANIRGILRYSQILAPSKLKEERDAFVKDYLSMSNDGGVVMLDQKMEYQPIESKPVLLSAEQTAAVQEKIYSYLGIAKEIVTSNYTEEQFAAFQESVIEPFAVALSLEFTAKIFNDREQAFGNAIIFDSGRMNYTSPKTKIELINTFIPYGILSINQALEILKELVKI